MTLTLPSEFPEQKATLKLRGYIGAGKSRRVVEKRIPVTSPKKGASHTAAAADSAPVLLASPTKASSRATVQQSAALLEEEQTERVSSSELDTAAFAKEVARIVSEESL